MNPQKSLLIQSIILIQHLIQNAEANIDQNSCKDVILRKNEFYCEIDNVNSFFTIKNTDNLTNTDTYQVEQDLIQVQSAPQLISKDEIFLMIKFRELTDQNELCSLIYNTQLKTYSINCISTQPTYIIDNKFQFNVNTKFSLEIQKTQNFNCSQFDYYQEGFIIFCYSFHQIKLFSLQKEQNIIQQTNIFESENQNLQCLLQFYLFQNTFYIVYIQCLDWRIQIYENNALKQEIDRNFLKEKHNIEGNLLDFKQCQTCFIVLLSSGGYIFKYETVEILFVKEDLKINQTLIMFDQHCNPKMIVKDLPDNKYIFSFPKKYQNLTFNTKDLPTNIIQIQSPPSLFILYGDYFTLYVNNILQQTIKRKIQNLLQHSNQKIFIGIEEGNQIIFLFIKSYIPCLPFKNENYQQSEYYYQFEQINKIHAIDTSYLNCYKTIIIDDENYEKKQENAIQINLKETYIYAERTNYEEQFEIFLSRSLIFSIKPYRLTLSSSLDNIKFKLRSNEANCQFNHYLKNYQGKFIIRTDNQQIYSIILQGSEDNLVEYNCQEKTIRRYQNVSPLDEQIILRDEDQIALFFLDQSKHCLYKTILENRNLDEMPMKIICLDTQIERVINLNYILLKVKDQNVFYNLQFVANEIHLIKVFLPQQITQKFQDIYLIRDDYFLIVYSNELHVLFKETITQRININCKILGIFSRIKSLYLVNVILLDIIKNELQFYELQQFEFRLTKSYNLELYVPIQPFEFKSTKLLLIISCQHKINKKLYLLIFNPVAQLSFHLLQQVIEIKNQYFWFSNRYLFYFDVKNQLTIEDVDYLVIEIENEQFTDKISQDVILQLQAELEDSEIPPVKQDIAITMLNPSIMKLINKSSHIFIEDTNQEINFRNNVLGRIDNIFLNNNENFKLRNPLEVEILMQCSYCYNKFCFQETNSGNVTFFKVGQSKNYYSAYDLEHLIQNLVFIEVIGENQFLFIHQKDQLFFSISLMILKDQIFQVQKQIDFIFTNMLYGIRLVQNILLISNYYLEYRFLIDQNDINPLNFSILNQGSLIENIDSETYLEAMVNGMEQIMLFRLFKIINASVQILQVFAVSISNYQIKDLIYGQAPNQSSNYLRLLKQKLNFDNQQLDLSIFFIGVKKIALLFQINLQLREQKYEINIRKILRYPESVQNCKFILIDYEEMILQCDITNYYYDMKTTEYLQDPIYSTKILQQVEILNSTHFLFYNFFQHNQSVVLSAGQRGGYVLQKLSQNITFPTTLEFKVIRTNQSYAVENDYLTSETFYLQVNQQEILQNKLSQLSFFIFLLIVLMLLAAIIFYYKKKQTQKNELGREVYKEISLSTIKLENSQKI
ncbi:unnamed protein product (macronuclear) [Paramecium tetraurelia]|uniref:Transmembrane protein n=1 Tax=Paramecium tetraurelia TaxID=5888 RepID=A0DH66_PARTE|nr:uncharacterized protein GSPATT00016769001 [Paramecium tetraurelia]CAK82383.1 unnamed protein product [Paramecium tetraurelia]|eukprot:XP_001449780.1 hypothetical protein (macronuclear) [Paramecium tetraurelia strain d4-2]